MTSPQTHRAFQGRLPGPLAAAALAVMVMTAGPAAAATLTVSATTDIWLAGQADGTVATGNFGSDTAPGNSPVLVPVAAGAVLQFAASGSTSVDASCFAGPDGGCYPDESAFGVGPANGIGTYQGPSNALLGVFLGSATPSGMGGPASMDFTQAVNIGQTSYAPALHQIFFIGDGQTGLATGAFQQFAAPAGATRLYLAVADSYGSSTGNLGSLAVDVSAVPEPGSLALMLSGLVAVAALAGQRKKTAP